MDQHLILLILSCRFALSLVSWFRSGDSSSYLCRRGISSWGARCQLLLLGRWRQMLGPCDGRFHLRVCIWLVSHVWDLPEQVACCIWLISFWWGNWVHICVKWKLLRRNLWDFLHMCSLLLVAGLVSISVGKCVCQSHAVVAFPNYAIREPLLVRWVRSWASLWSLAAANHVTVRFASGSSDGIIIAAVIGTMTANSQIFAR